MLIEPRLSSISNVAWVAGGTDLRTADHGHYRRYRGSSRQSRDVAAAGGTVESELGIGVRIRHDQASIHRKFFPADQPGSNAARSTTRSPKNNAVQRARHSPRRPVT